MAISQPLAIDGGPPVIPDGPPSWPQDDPDVRAAILNALDDGSWGRYLGPHVRRLANLLGEQFDVPYVLPCCSGTFAVELALRSLDIRPGDEVILAAYDFSGNFRSIEALGATPVLVDLAAGQWQIDAGQIDRAAGPQTRAVVVSHLHGGIADMRQICAIAADRRLAVVEDACQAPAAVVQGRAVGTWGDVGVVSFGGSKLLTAGRGGAIFTRREDCFQRAKIFCEQGNHAFPLSELQAAALVPQLQKLAAQNAHRLENARRLAEQCSDIRALKTGGTLPPDSSPCFYKLPWFFDADACGGWTRARFAAAVQAEGVALDAGFRGFSRRGSRCRKPCPLDNAVRAAESTLLLHHPVLLASWPVVERVAVAIKKVAAAAVSEATESEAGRREPASTEASLRHSSALRRQRESGGS